MLHKRNSITRLANEEIDYKLAAEQLRSGQPLFGKNGALTQLCLYYHFKNR